MSSYHLNDVAISIEKQGPSHMAKTSFPIRYGKYSEIKTAEYEFIFNLNGEIKFIRGLNVNWPHPSERLKRTDGNDWVYYSVGDDSSENGIISWLGEYYLPCLPYPSNAVWEYNYFSNPNIMNAFAAWSQLYANLQGARTEGQPSKVKDFINLICGNDESVLYEKSQRLRGIIGGRVSVLPPDTRYADYEIIPLIIADGCLYHCKFCCVKSSQAFQRRSETNIIEQIRQLKTFYGRNLENYNALFLGNHDALGAGDETIFMAVSEAVKAFGFAEPRTKTPMLFLFGSVDSLLKAGDEFIAELNRLPFYTYINIGLESVDAPTLAHIHKPLDSSKIREAFGKMLEINRTFANVEITANFLLGKELSPDHYQSLAELLHDAPVPSRGKGAIYLSPLKDSPKKRELLPLFFEIKKQSRIATYIYLIQRL